MTDLERLAFDLLYAFDIAVLHRVSPRKYAFLGQAPLFYDSFFPPECHDGQATPCAAPWEHSPMLEFFLPEAEDFFERGGQGTLASGLWKEDGKTSPGTALKAFAVALPAGRLLLIRMIRDEYREHVTALRKAREQLLENRELSQTLAIVKEKSRLDGLTSIFNRATFMDLLHDETKRSQILDYPLVLLILDIDDFKKINDTYGHLAGDAVLRNMGALLKKSLRRNDIVARYGGEEFAVLIPHETVEQAARIADKIRLGVAAMVVPDVPRISVSIGCTRYVPAETFEDFFERADLALYDAKKGGKNVVRIR